MSAAAQQPDATEVLIAQNDGSGSDASADESGVDEAPEGGAQTFASAALTVLTPARGPVAGMADLHLHQWAEMMNAAQWLHGHAAGPGELHLQECGWLVARGDNYPHEVTPRQLHGQLIGKRRQGTTLRRLMRTLWGSERSDDVVSSHPPAGISRDRNVPHWMGWPTSDSVAHQQVWEGWLRLAHDGLPLLHFMDEHDITDTASGATAFYGSDYAANVTAAHADGVAGLNLVVVSLVHSVAGCRQATPRRALRRDPTLCSDMDSVLRQYRVATEWAHTNRDWVEIVASPERARQVIGEGRLAIVLSIEASDIFGAAADTPSYFDSIDLQNDFRASVRSGIALWLDRMPLLSTFQIAHQLDNAFSAASYIKPQLSAFSRIRFARRGDCEWINPEADQRRRRPRGAVHPGDVDPDGAARYAACLEQATLNTRGLLSGLGAGGWRRQFRNPERYAQDGIAANPWGLSIMGEALVEEMIDRQMPIDASHMSDVSRERLFDYLEELEEPHYPVYLSHAYPSTTNALRREQNLDPSFISDLRQHGGLVGLRPGDDEHVIPAQPQSQLERDASLLTCQGTSVAARLHVDAVNGLPTTFGTDLNGFINQTRPAGLNRPEWTLDAEGSGPASCSEVIADIGSEVRTRGLAHIGLLPSTYLEMLFSADEPDEQQSLLSMGGGAEAYIRLWERATSDEPVDRNRPLVDEDSWRPSLDMLDALLFDDEGTLLSYKLQATDPGDTRLNAQMNSAPVDPVAVDDTAVRAQRASGAGKEPLTAAGPQTGLILPRLRAIEAVLPYGARSIEAGTGPAQWTAYPQLPTTIGLLMGTQSFNSYQVGLHFPISFCRKQQDENSAATCDKLADVRRYYRRRIFRRHLSAGDRFSRWDREYPDLNRRVAGGTTPDGFGPDWQPPAQLGPELRIKEWLTVNATRARNLDIDTFENAPAPGLSFELPSEYLCAAFADGSPTSCDLGNVDPERSERPNSCRPLALGRRNCGTQLDGYRAYCTLLRDEFPTHVLPSWFSPTGVCGRLGVTMDDQPE